jgi:hypothetical protein
MKLAIEGKKKEKRNAGEKEFVFFRVLEERSRGKTRKK